MTVCVVSTFVADSTTGVLLLLVVLVVVDKHRRRRGGTNVVLPRTTSCGLWFHSLAATCRFSTATRAFHILLIDGWIETESKWMECKAQRSNPMQNATLQPTARIMSGGKMSEWRGGAAEMESRTLVVDYSRGRLHLLGSCAPGLHPAPQARSSLDIIPASSQQQAST